MVGGNKLIVIIEFEVLINEDFKIIMTIIDAPIPVSEHSPMCKRILAEHTTQKL